MPIYEGMCLAGHHSEELLPMGTQAWTCRCGAPVRKAPSRFAQLNPPTGAALRSQFSLYREATAEIDHAYTRVETDLERPVQSPDLWNIAKSRAQAMVAAGEAPSLANPLKE